MKSSFKYIGCIILALLVHLCSLHTAYGQCPSDYPVVTGTTTSYEIPFSSTITNIYWYVSVTGTIIGDRTHKAVDIQWTQPGPGTVNVVYYVNGVETSQCWSISVRNAINPGSISTGISSVIQNQIFSYNNLVNSTAASDGIGQDYGVPYAYQWQESFDGTTWANIGGATGQDGTGSTLFDKKMYFRRSVYDGYNTAYSNVLSINLTNALTPGTIAASQNILPGNAPAKLSSTLSPAGGNGTFSYQWESSTDNQNWTTISSATAIDYQPASLNNTTWFRRKVNASGQIATSNVVQVKVKGTDASNIPLTSASQGNVTKINPPDFSAVNVANLNSITSYIITKPGITNASQINTLTAKRDITTTNTYVDGLRRIIETVQINGGATTQDAVSFTQFDQFGRSNIQHLPYLATTDASGKGKFKTDVSTAQPNFYNTITQNKDDYFYVQSITEASPVSRYLKSVDAGASYAGNNIGTVQSDRMNTEEDHVRIWQIGNAITDLPASNGEYAAGTLQVSIVTDADGNNTYRYTDRNGKVVMDARQGNTTYYKDELRTYYVQDDIGNTRYVIPPLATKDWWSKTTWDFAATAETQAALKALGYKYYYDNKGRVVVKEKAGIQGAYSFVYDNRNRLVFVQDATLKSRNKGEWILYLYDNMDRTVMMALYTNTTATRESLQSSMDQVTGVSSAIAVTTPADRELHVYSNENKTSYNATESIIFEPGFVSDMGKEFTAEINAAANQVTENFTVSNPLPNISGYTPMVIYYYDNYSWSGAQSFEPNYILDAGNNPNAQVFNHGSNNTFGKATGYKKLVSGTDKWIKGTYYYDDYGQIIQALETNFKSGINVTTNQYDYAGKVLSSFNRITNPQSKTDPIIYTQERAEYDDNGNITQRYYSISKDLTITPKQINEITYDDLKRTKFVSIGEGLEAIKFDYDLMGRITGVNADFVNDKNAGNYFGMQMSYDKGFTNRKLDGNLSGVSWRRKGNSDVAHAYGYTYDTHNRLSKADYSQNVSGWTNSDEDYTVSIPQYDENGNILKMKQEGMLAGKAKATIDDLTYEYQTASNKLNGVTDLQGNKQVGDFKNYNGRTAGSIDYTYDETGNITGDKNRGISITYDYLLDKPQKISFDANTNKYITYTRDVTGNLLERTVKNESANNVYTYIGNSLYRNDSLLYVLFDGGRIRKTSDNTFVYDYFLSDHLGNTRTVITEETNVYGYKATHEDNPDPAPVVPEKELFSFPTQLDDIPVGNKFYDYNGKTNRKFIKLNYTDANRRIGTSKVLRVMAGDQVELGVLSYFAANSADNNTPNKPVNDILNQLVNVLLGPASVIGNGKGNLLQGANGTILNQQDFNTFIQNNQNDNPPSNTPKAYLNYALFDDNFQFVSGSAIRVNTPGDVMPLATQLAVNKNGYLYIYVSNESTSDVYFDDLTIKHTTGHLLQEDSYYPYGLQIQGLSSAAANRLQNEHLFNGMEKINDLDLQLYEAFYRNLDPQTGRWLQVDPIAEKYGSISGYANNFDNPVNLSDPLGNDPLGDDPPWWLQYFQGIGTNGNSAILLNAVDIVGKNLSNRSINIRAAEQVMSFVTPDYFNIEEEVRQHYRKMMVNRMAAYQKAKQAQQQQMASLVQQLNSIHKLPPATFKDPGTISVYTPDAFDTWAASDNIIAQATYAPTDGAWVTLQCLLPFLQADGVYHLNDELATKTDRVRGFADVTSTVITDEVGTIASKAMAPILGAGLTKFGKWVDPKVISAGDFLRIENAATKIKKPITVVGSRAKGTASAFSDWDYVIEGLNNKDWKSIKNSLPGSKSLLDNTPRNIDIFEKLDPTKPYITINPR